MVVDLTKVSEPDWTESDGEEVLSVPQSDLATVLAEQSNVNSDGLKPWHPKELSTRHKQIIVMAASGLKPGEIARALEMSNSRVSVILNDPRSKMLQEEIAAEQLSHMLTDTMSYIQANAMTAAKKVVSLMNGAESERVQQTSAFDILDRAGFKPVERSISANLDLDQDMAEELMGALRESRMDEAVPEPVEDTSQVFDRGRSIVSARK